MYKCDCTEKIKNELLDRYKCQVIVPPTEMFSGKLYVSFEAIRDSKQSNRYIPVLLDNCPFCGSEYIKGD